MQSDLVLLNGRIHTLDAQTPHATAVAIRDNRILFVGDDEAARQTLRAGGETIDLRGRCVVPGLTDAHLHFSMYAIALQSVEAH